MQIVEQGTSTTAPDDPTYVIPAENATLTWDNDRMGGTYRITIPAGHMLMAEAPGRAAEILETAI